MENNNIKKTENTESGEKNYRIHRNGHGKNNFHNRHNHKKNDGDFRRDKTTDEVKADNITAPEPAYDETVTKADVSATFENVVEKTAKTAPVTDKSPETEASNEEFPEIPAEVDASVEKVEIVGVRFKPVGKIYYFDPAGIELKTDDGVILETARGVEYGTVAISNRMVSVSEIVSPLKKIIRKATAADLEKLEKNREVEKRAREIWSEQVEKHGLDMTLVDVEYTFDNTKLLFYFTAEGRVDFRNFVKDVAAVFKTRIELRQIGVRDEAKQVGGFGVCGREFCCRTFLDEFQQVSIKMAKEQGLSLNSVKISGTCGRLMCCLRYENDTYEEELKKTPAVDSIVETPDGKGVVVESNVLAGLVKVRLDGMRETAPRLFSREQVKILGKIRRNDNEMDEELKKLQD